MHDFRTALFQVRKEMQEIMDMIVLAEGLNAAEAMVLTHLAHRDSAPLGEIVRHCRLNQGNASTLCKRMEQNGLITRTRCGDDERVVRLALTETGRASVNRIKANGDVLRSFIEAEAARRGVVLDEMWTLMNEIFMSGIEAYRRAQSDRNDAEARGEESQSRKNAKQ